MKFRIALMLCGAVLMTAAPALADGIPHREFSKNSAIAGGSASMIASPSQNFDRSANAGFFAHHSDPDTFAVGNNKFSADSNASFFRAADSDFDRGGRGDLVSYRSGSPWLSGREFINGKKKGQTSPSTDVAPEPGSLSFLLLGLLGIGFVARRRKASPFAA